jgi:hypothetical protein
LFKLNLQQQTHYQHLKYLLKHLILNYIVAVFVSLTAPAVPFVQLVVVTKPTE